MKEYFMICFRGCLNGQRKTFIDLLVIELNEKKKNSPVMFVYNLMNCLYEKRGKGELGPKNGPRTNGWLDVLKISQLPEKYELEVIKMNSSDITGVYKIIKESLKKAIAEKIKIEKKEE